MGFMAGKRALIVGVALAAGGPAMAEVDATRVFEQLKDLEGMWKGIATFVRKRGDYIDFGYNQICASGPMSARDFNEGKKIGVKDLFNALYCIVRYGLAD